MTEYDNTNRGSIWKNEKMREGKQDPEFTGALNVEGKEYWVSAWRRKEGASAKAPALSFTIKPKDVSGLAADRIAAGDKHLAVHRKARDEVGRGDSIEDEIPFIMEWRG